MRGADALPDVLDGLRRRATEVRGAITGTMLRNEVYNFLQLGTALERADNTARIVDVKYHILLPRSEDVGGTLDTLQWEQLLFALHARRSYMREYGPDYSGPQVAELLVLNPRMPRSLAFCLRAAADQLEQLAERFGERPPVVDRAAAMARQLAGTPIGDILRDGLHERLTELINDVAALTDDLAVTYRFTA